MYVWFLTEAWDYWIRKIMGSCVFSAISCNFFIFLMVGGDTSNYFGDLNCHLAGRVLITAMWWALRWSLVYVTRKNKKPNQSNPNPMPLLFKIVAISCCALWSFSTCLCSRLCTGGVLGAVAGQEQNEKCQSSREYLMLFIIWDSFLTCAVSQVSFF